MKKPRKKPSHTVYLIETKTPGMFYVGRSVDLPKRIREHRAGRKAGGALFTDKHGVKHVYVLADKLSSAMAGRLEYGFALALDDGGVAGTVSYGPQFGRVAMHPATFGVCCTTMPGAERVSSWPVERAA